MERVKLMQELIRDERLEHFFYYDTRGIPTVGVGRNLRDVGLSNDEIEFMLNNDVSKVERDLDRELPWWRGLDEVRQRVLANMVFNMGIHRFLGFRKMLGALEARDFPTAADEMRDSDWFRQVGVRGPRLVDAMRRGVCI